MQKEFMFIAVSDQFEGDFRPHNWAERIAGNMASFGKDRRLHFSGSLMPVMKDSKKYLRVCPSLCQTNPGVFRDVIRFAKINQMDIHGAGNAECQTLKAALEAA